MQYLIGTVQLIMTVAANPESGFYGIDLRARSCQSQKPRIVPHQEFAHDLRRIAIGIYGDIERLDAVRQTANPLQRASQLAQ